MTEDRVAVSFPHASKNLHCHDKNPATVLHEEERSLDVLEERVREDRGREEEREEGENEVKEGRKEQRWTEKGSSEGERER